jgi:hypothetical protein
MFANSYAVGLRRMPLALVPNLSLLLWMLLDNNAVVSNSSPKSNHVIFIPMISYASRV